MKDNWRRGEAEQCKYERNVRKKGKGTRRDEEMELIKDKGEVREKDFPREQITIGGTINDRVRGYNV